MKLKLDQATGKAEVQDGKPVYVRDNGEEIAFDAPGSVAKIKLLSEERDRLRISGKESADKLAQFGDADPEKVKAAIELAANLDGKKLVDAGKIDELVSQRLQAHREAAAKEKEAADRRVAELEDALYTEKVGRSVAESRFIKEETFLTPDLVLSRWRPNLKIEEGRVVGYDDRGQRIYNAQGEDATPDEILRHLASSHPDKDRFIRDRGGSGAGANGGAAANGQSGAGQKQLRRVAFDALPPAQQMAHIKGGGAVVD
jgi:hypothetical protein